MASRLWDARGSEVSPAEYAAIESEERLVYQAQKAVRQLLKQKGLKASDLARLLGVSEARVSQMLGGEARNLTLRTLARIFHVLGSRCLVAAADAPIASKERERPAEVAAGPAECGEQREARPEADEHAGRNIVLAAASEWSQRLVELSDQAAFGTESVWASSLTIVPANENDRESDEGAARNWMAAPLRYEDEYEHEHERESERLYA